MIDIFEIGGKITLDGVENVGKKIDNLVSKAEKAGKKIAKFSSIAIGAAATGIAALTKSSIEEYAAYEQLVGGVETLFKDSADAVKKYAASAYKTAGLSANQYMETVTSFSASLLQSLDGDTAAAAEKANTAITDMSDNANKMGTDISMIQSAYSGFAKQNYTMLDNLKLGYGGTKEEMQRLLDDANRLNAANGKFTNYTLDSYADIIDAIHDVQTEMGITGTTAKEASSTIQGSVDSAKSAWKNLLVGISDENQDFDNLVNEFVESVETAADNVIPRIDRALDGILELVKVASEKIVPRVIGTISENAPDLIESGAEIVLALCDGIVDNSDRIFSAIEKTLTRVVPKLASAFSELVPKIAKSAGKIIKEIDGVAFTVGGLYGAFKSLLKGNWIGVGIGLITAAYGRVKTATEKQEEAIWGLTEAEKEMINAGKEAADALRAAKNARDENIGSILLETEKTKDLWGELQTLVDKNGHVLDGKHEQVDYILGELNDALGTEYSRNGDLIEQYQEMGAEIDTLLEKKKLEALMSAGADAYADAAMNEGALWDIVAEEKEKVDSAQAEYDKYYKIWSETDDQDIAGYAKDKMLVADRARKKAEKALDEAIAAAEEATNIRGSYEEAERLMAQGKYGEATSAFLSTYDPTKRVATLDEESVTKSDIEPLKESAKQTADRIDAIKKLYGEKPSGYMGETLDAYNTDYYKSVQLLSTAIVKGFLPENTPEGMLLASTVNPERSTQSSAQPQTIENNINIEVKADTLDLSDRIAQAVLEAVSRAVQSRGVATRGGRTQDSIGGRKVNVN